MWLNQVMDRAPIGLVGADQHRVECLAGFADDLDLLGLLSYRLEEYIAHDKQGACPQSSIATPANASARRVPSAPGARPGQALASSTTARPTCSMTSIPPKSRPSARAAA